VVPDSSLVTDDIYPKDDNLRDERVELKISSKWQSSTSEADGRSAGQESLRLLWKQVVHYRIHKVP
jgi:hypothetical protein